VDVETARALTSTFIEAVIAPSIEEAAREVLAAKANMRVVTADFAALLQPSAFGPEDMRSVPRRDAAAGARLGGRSTASHGRLRRHLTFAS
jgi:hypothetical protein